MLAGTELVRDVSCPGLHPTVDRLVVAHGPPDWVGALKESRASRVQACTRPSTGSLVGPRPSRLGWSPPQCLMRLEEALKDNRRDSRYYLSRAVRPTASGDKVGPTCTVTRDTQWSLVRQQRAPRTWQSPSTHRVTGAIKDQGDRDEVGEELVHSTVCRTTVHRCTPHRIVESPYDRRIPSLRGMGSRTELERETLEKMC